MIINQELLNKGLSINSNILFEANQLGLVNSNQANTLSFIDDEKFLSELNSNNNISVVITTIDFESKINKTKKIIIVDDSRYHFYKLLNYTGKSNYVKSDSFIDKSSIIHTTAHIAEHNVTIGKNTIIGPNVTIMADVIIGDNCVIQPGTVVGSEGFEYKRTTKGILPVFHDGKVVIGNNVDIGSNTCIDKGFSFKTTIIEDEVKIDNLIHVAHGVHIKKGAFIIAGTVLGGSTVIGENSWISINASISPGITVGSKGFVSMGAVVTRNVEDNQQVTGNLAVPHPQFLKIFKKNLKDIS